MRVNTPKLKAANVEQRAGNVGLSPVCGDPFLHDLRMAIMELHWLRAHTPKSDDLRSVVEEHLLNALTMQDLLLTKRYGDEP